MSNSFEDSNTVMIYDYSDGDKKTENLNNIAWEYWKHKKDTNKVRLIYYKNISMQLGKVDREKLPGHPHALEIAFHNVTFYDQGKIYLEKCPNLKVVCFVNCRGVLRLDALELDAIILGSENDRKCFYLNNSSASRVICLDEVYKDDPEKEIERHMLSSFKRITAQREQQSSSGIGSKYVLDAIGMVGEQAEAVKKLQQQLDRQKADKDSKAKLLVEKDAEIARIQLQMTTTVGVTQNYVAQVQYELQSKEYLAYTKQYQYNMLQSKIAEKLTYVAQLQQDNTYIQIQNYAKDQRIAQLQFEKYYELYTLSELQYYIDYMNNHINNQLAMLKAAGTQQNMSALQQQVNQIECQLVQLKKQQDQELIYQNAELIKAQDYQAALQVEVNKMIREKTMAYTATRPLDLHKCYKCGNMTFSVEELRNHTPGCNGPKKKCARCEIELNTDTELTIHMNSHMERDQSLVAREQYANQYQYGGRQVIQQVYMQYYYCQICWQYVGSAVMQQHMQMHGK